MHCVDDTAEVVVEQNNVTGIFGDLRATSHGDTDMRVTKGRHVIHSVTSHSGDIVLFEKR
ncbi:hypothetical protein D3C87_1774450 [compost metagenome]